MFYKPSFLPYKVLIYYSPKKLGCCKKFFVGVLREKPVLFKQIFYHTATDFLNEKITNYYYIEKPKPIWVIKKNQCD